MYWRAALLTGILIASVGLIVHASEARALSYVIQNNPVYASGILARTGLIETAGILDDGESLDITSLRVSGLFLEPEFCIGNLCTDPFVRVVSIELDSRETSRLKLRRQGDLLLTQGAVHLLLSAFGTTLPVTLDVEESASLVANIICSADVGDICQILPIPNSASTGLLEFDGVLRFPSGYSGPLTFFYGLGFSAVPEPSSGLLVLVGATSLAWYRRKRSCRFLPAFTPSSGIT